MNCMSRGGFRALGSVLIPVAALGFAFAAPPPRVVRKPIVDASARKQFAETVLPVVRTYCVDCHKGERAAAGIDVTLDGTLDAMVRRRSVWERIAANLASEAMPPAGSKAPTRESRAAVVTFVESTLSKVDCAVDDPGRVTMRRLNRVEYRNTIRDLLGVETDAADAFPSDDVGYGFDNIGDVLTISPLLMEKYLDAARRIARAAVVSPEDRAGGAQRFEGGRLEGSGGGPNGGAFGFGTVGRAGVDVLFPAAGDYVIEVSAWGHQAGNEPCRMEVLLGEQVLATVDVAQREGSPGTFRAKVRVDTPGRRRIGVGFVNDYYFPAARNPADRDRNLFVESVALLPPASVPLIGDLPASHRRIVAARPADSSSGAWSKAAGTSLAPLARRAYRRPLRAGELDRLVRLALTAREGGFSYERGIQLAVQGLLVSPHFLFRVELDPRPNDPSAKRSLDGFEIATRLSYLLWSSMPDDALLARAGSGGLSKPEVLRSEVRRMLRDPRSAALADNFAGQWLQLRKLSVVQPDPQRFPQFDEALREAMRQETRLFFSDVVQSDRSVLDFLDGRHTFANERLANLYGIPGIAGEGFRRVALPDSQRGGLLGHASILTLTSNPGRTSPVKRGKWVLENLLGTPPPPPPPNVPELPEDKKGGSATPTTVRQRLEIHRRNPACNACH